MDKIKLDQASMRELHGTPCGQAHKRFHRVIDGCGAEPADWEQAAADLRRSPQDAMKAHVATEGFTLTAPVPHAAMTALL